MGASLLPECFEATIPMLLFQHNSYDASTSDRFLPDWLRRCARSYPNRQALRMGQTDHPSLTFAELDARVTALAGRLAAHGAHTGDTIALLAANSLEYAIFVHAAARLGTILVPLNVRLTADELAWQCADAQATLLAHNEAHSALAKEVGQRTPAIPLQALESLVAPPPHGRRGKMLDGESFPPSRSQEGLGLGSSSTPFLSREEGQGERLIDLAATQAIIYTSGTTGRPKGARITSGMFWWNAISSALNLGLREDDCWLACLPFYHIGGLSILMRSVIYGMSVSVYERFDAPAIHAELLAGEVSMISVVAVTLQRLLDQFDRPDMRYPDRLRCVLLGGGPAPRPLLEECARRSIPVAQTYGMTESCSQATTLPPADALGKLGSAGRPLAAVQLRVMRDTAAGVEAEAGEAGEIALRGPTVTPGYINRPEANAQAFHDGWFATGDIGYLDEDGYLYVLDRRADLIISGGENVYPAEIESALLAHPAVEEAGIIGLVDEQWGQAPVAFVRLREAIDEPPPEELRAFVAQRLARYKVPREVYIVDEPLPRNSGGKLLRRELAKLAYHQE